MTETEMKAARRSNPTFSAGGLHFLGLVAITNPTSQSYVGCRTQRSWEIVHQPTIAHWHTDRDSNVRRKEIANKTGIGRFRRSLGEGQVTLTESKAITTSDIGGMKKVKLALPTISRSSLQSSSKDMLGR